LPSGFFVFLTGRRQTAQLDYFFHLDSSLWDERREIEPIREQYTSVQRADLADPDDFKDLRESFDTVICVDGLEHVPDEAQAVRNLRDALEPGGNAIARVPQNPAIYGTLDEALGHGKRYTRATLRAAAVVVAPWRAAALAAEAR